jgi:uncharacterized protein YecA (UPF0149 family)
MHDETLPVVIDSKELEVNLKQLAAALKVSQATATTVTGYVMKITGQVLTSKETYEWIKELLKMKTPEMLTLDERLLCITLGVLKRKTPFVASASKVGRNDPCPCESGAKYKNCCLELAKAHDYERFYGGKG